jgi:hypothetical protein
MWRAHDTAFKSRESCRKQEGSSVSGTIITLAHNQSGGAQNYGIVLSLLSKKLMFYGFRHTFGQN